MHRLTSAVSGDVLQQLLAYPTVEHFLTEHYTGGPRTHGGSSSGGIAAAQHAWQQLESYIVSNIGPQHQSGHQIMQHVSSEQRIIPTGCDSLDAVMGGGLREGFLTEVAGESASGKTQVMLQLAAITALRDEGVVYVDTTSSFSAERLLAIAAAHAGPEVALDAQRLLSHVLVLRAHSVSEALLLLDQLAAAMHARWSRLRQGQGQGPANQQQQQQQANADGSGWTCIGQRQHGGEAVAGTTASEAGSQHRLVDDTALPSAAMPSVLIVDSVSAVVTPVLGGQQHSQGHALMLSLARMLKQLAGRYKLAVVVTNHVVSGDWRRGGQQQGGAAAGTNSRPAMGEHWRNQASCRVQLSQQQGDLRMAELTASATHALGQQAWFMMDESGVVAVPPPERDAASWHS